MNIQRWSDRSGTYYLLPEDWNPQHDLTYIFNQSDPIRIELEGALS
jgi:hypothetical protein